MTRIANLTNLGIVILLRSNLSIILTSVRHHSPIYFTDRNLKHTRIAKITNLSLCINSSAVRIYIFFNFRKLTLPIWSLETLCFQKLNSTRKHKNQLGNSKVFSSQKHKTRIVVNSIQSLQTCFRKQITGFEFESVTHMLATCNAIETKTHIKLN